VLGITTPGTGAGPTSSLGWLGMFLILLGSALVVLQRLRHSGKIKLEEV
jgi:LPXTG-motif cell wall-anchored protein